MCLARSLLGESMNDGVLELNASDDRGIDVVRNKIKMFAQKKLNLPSGRHKLVFLDEADSMTSAAQQAMRRTMEIHSHSTRFALACNQSEKIIEPIQSRCAIVRFTRLSDEHITSRLKHVVESERVAYSPDGLGAIVFTADGDMRQAINNLQVHFVCLFLYRPFAKTPTVSRCYTMPPVVNSQRLRLHRPRERVQGVRPAAPQDRRSRARRLQAR